MRCLTFGIHRVLVREWKWEYAGWRCCFWVVSVPTPGFRAQAWVLAAVSGAVWAAGAGVSALTLAAKLASNPSCPLGDRPLGSSSVQQLREAGSPSSSSSRPAASARFPQQRASTANAGISLLFLGPSAALLLHHPILIPGPALTLALSVQASLGSSKRPVSLHRACNSDVPL